MAAEEVESGVPLVAEVEAVLAKERELLSLRLLAEQREADSWKERYSELRDRLLNQAERDGDAEVLALIADELEQTEYSEWGTGGRTMIRTMDDTGLGLSSALRTRDFASTSALSGSQGGGEYIDEEFLGLSDVSRVLLERRDGHVLDLSDLRFSPRFFVSVVKQLFPLRIAANSPAKSPPVRVILLRNSEISPLNEIPLCLALRGSQISAVDLSFNRLTEPMVDGLLQVLRGRKMTPQYLLLNGNMFLAAGKPDPQAPTLISASPTSTRTNLNSNVWMGCNATASLVRVLTRDTWGLCVSLQDFHTIPRFEADSRPKKALKADAADETAAYRELLKPPNRAQTFLETLLKMLQPETMDTALEKTKKTRKTSNNNRLGLLGKVTPRELNTFRSLSVFGLTECILNSTSHDLLQEVLFSMRDTLTDIDLSFSYLSGTTVLRVLEPIIRNSESLIRLELRGNSIDDSSAIRLAEMLTSNNTLTYLGLSSNHLSSEGAMKLSLALSTLPCLYTVDLRSNKAVSTATRQRIQKWCDDSAINAFFRCDQFSTRSPDTTDLLFAEDKLEYRPHLYRSAARTGRPVRFFAANFASMHSRLMDSFGPEAKKYNDKQVKDMPTGFIIRFFMRPLPLIGFEKALEQLYGAVDSDAYFRLGSHLRIQWEFRVLQGSQPVMSHRVDVTDSFLTCGLWSAEQSATIDAFSVAMPDDDVLQPLPDLSILPCEDSLWLPCSLLVPTLPRYGTLELRWVLTTVSGKSLGEDIIAVESKLLAIMPAWQQDSYVIGSEGSLENDTIRQVIEESTVMALPLMHSLLNDVQHLWIGEEVRQSTMRETLGYSSSTLKGLTVQSFFANHQVLRCFAWNVGHSMSDQETARISWSTRLRYQPPQLVSGTTLSSGVAGGVEIPHKLRISLRGLAYVWTITVISPGNHSPPRIAAFGRCRGAENVDDPLDTLAPWVWQSFSVDIPNLYSGETLLLTARQFWEEGLSPSELSIENTPVVLEVASSELRVVCHNSFNRSIEELNSVVPAVVFDPLQVYTAELAL